MTVPTMKVMTPSTKSRPSISTPILPTKEQALNIVKVTSKPVAKLKTAIKAPEMRSKLPGLVSRGP